MNHCDLQRRFTAANLSLQIASAHVSEASMAWLDDAVLIHRAEPILSCVDAVMGDALDWQPAMLSDAGASPWMLQICPHATEVPEAYLTLDESELTDASIWENALSGIAQLRWQHRELQVALSEVALSAEDAGRIGPGSLLVLPASFESSLQARISCATTPSLSMIGHIDQSSRELTVQEVCAGPADEGEPCGSQALHSAASIGLEHALAVPVHAWHRQRTVGSTLTRLPPFCELALRVTVEGRSWWGQGTAIGNGLGVLIEHRLIDTPVATPTAL